MKINNAKATWYIESGGFLTVFYAPGAEIAEGTQTLIVRTDSGDEVTRFVGYRPYSVEAQGDKLVAYYTNDPDFVPEVERGPTEQEDIAAMLIDQEYRLTLLELGVTG